jgi:hypothetical protein
MRNELQSLDANVMMRTKAAERNFVIHNIPGQ